MMSAALVGGRMLGPAGRKVDATSTLRLHLGGIVNVDEIHFPSKGFSGLTFRAFHVSFSRG